MSQSWFICTQVNSFKCCYQTLIVQFNNNDLFAHSSIVSSMVNDKTVLFDS